MTDTTATTVESVRTDPVRHGFGRDTALVTICTLISRVTGFGRVVATAAVLGTGVLGDVYQTANMIPNLMFELVAGGVLQAVLVPSFVAAWRSDSDDGLGRATQATMGVVVAALTGVAAIGMVFAPLLAHLLVSGDPSSAVAHDKFRLMVPMVLMFVPQLVCYGIATVASSALNAKGRYVTAALAPAVNNVIVVVACVLFRLERGTRLADLDLSTWQFVLIAGGTTAGVLAFSLTPAFALSARGTRWRPIWEPHHPAVRSLRTSFGWATLSIVGTLVPTAAALALGNGAEGGVAVFVYAFAFFVLPHALIAVTVATTLAPRVAQGWQAGHVREVATTIESSMKMVMPMLACAGAAMLTLAWPLTRVVTEVGQTASRGHAPIAHTLAAFGPGLLGYGVSFVMIRVLFSLGDVRRGSVLMVSGAVVGVGVMVIASAVMDPTERAAALAVGYGAAQTVVACLLVVRVHRLTGALGPSRAFGLLVESLLAGGLSGGAMWVVVTSLSDSRAAAFVGLLLGGAAGVVAFSAAMVLLRGRDLVRRPPRLHGTWKSRPVAHDDASTAG